MIRTLHGKKYYFHSVKMKLMKLINQFVTTTWIAESSNIL